MAKNRYDCPACSTKITGRSGPRGGFGLNKYPARPCPHCGAKLRVSPLARRKNSVFAVGIVISLVVVAIATSFSIVLGGAMSILWVAILFLIDWIFFNGPHVELAPLEDET